VKTPGNAMIVAMKGQKERDTNANQNQLVDDKQVMIYIFDLLILVIVVNMTSSQTHT
jgi:hypothetical protein